jgi:hypothetical protein
MKSVAPLKHQPEKMDLAAADKIHFEKREFAEVVKKQPKKRGSTASEKIQPKVNMLSATVIEPPQKKISPVYLGTRYKCYKCGTMFYDLGRPEPSCPSCGVNQNDDKAKVIHKRKRGRRWSSTFARTEDHNITAPMETADGIEVVNEVDAEYSLDMDDIVFDEHTDEDNSDE